VLSRWASKTPVRGPERQDAGPGNAGPPSKRYLHGVTPPPNRCRICRFISRRCPPHQWHWPGAQPTRSGEARPTVFERENAQMPTPPLYTSQGTYDVGVHDEAAKRISIRPRCARQPGRAVFPRQSANTRTKSSHTSGIGSRTTGNRNLTICFSS